MKEIRLTVKEKMNELNITRYALAQSTNTKYQTIDNYYKNKVKQYDSEILLRICNGLECDISDIIKIFDSPGE